MAKESLLWFAGREQAGKADKIPIEDPATGGVIAYCHAASAEDVADAIAAGEQAFNSGVWSRKAPADRAAVLTKMSVLFTECVPELAKLESLQTGRTLREMKTQLGRLGEWFDYFAALARTEEGSVQPTRGALLNYVKRVPLGVVAQITPFNHPLLITIKKLAPALAAGNSVIVKPSELAPLTALELGKIAKEAGIPDGVLSILPGYGAIAGKALVESPVIRKVDVTGGTPGGRVIGSIVGRNLASYTAELGGKAPIIVFKSVDLDMAVNGVAFASFIASGQTCVAGTRIMVEEAIYDEFVRRLTSKSESIARRMGSPSHEGSMMGPIISQKQLDGVERLVNAARDQGATIVTGGTRMSGAATLDGIDLGKGYFYPPTLISGSDNVKVTDTAIWREEAFGPVLVLASFKSEDEALALANDCDFGLGSAIWTQDGSQAIRVADKMEAGLVWVNTHHRNDPSSPWGGMKQSGIGRENGLDAYHSYTQSKSVIYNYAPTAECLQTDDWFREGGGAVRYG